MLEPALPEYLNTPRAAKSEQRGGTLIAEDVWDPVEHRLKVAHPDGYRPDGCPRCQGLLYGHGCRSRTLRDQPDRAAEEIRRYLCSMCRAVWQVLPAFLARHLHRTWGAIQSRLVAAGAIERTGAERRVAAKPTTTARWLDRLQATAIVLTQALVECGEEVGSVVRQLGIGCSRQDLVEGLAAVGLVEQRHKLGELACWIDRVVPGVRVM
jgi:hypothetical protein